MQKIKRLIPKFRKVYLLELKNGNQIVAGSVSEQIQFHLITKKNVKDISSTRGDEIGHVFEQCLHEGHIGMYAFNENRIVGCLWAYIPRKRKIRMWGGVDAFPGEALLARGYVSAEERGKGIYAALVRKLSQHLFESMPQIQRVFADVVTSSVPARKAFENAGFQVYGTLSYIYVGRFNLVKHFQKQNSAVNV